MKNVPNKLRVVHYPQIGSSGSGFEVEVKDEEQAYFVINLLANQHLWLFENRIIGDYANAILVQMYDESIDKENRQPYGWCDYWNEEECMDWEDVEENYFRQ